MQGDLNAKTYATLREVRITEDSRAAEISVKPAHKSLEWALEDEVKDEGGRQTRTVTLMKATRCGIRLSAGAVLPQQHREKRA